MINTGLVWDGYFCDFDRNLAIWRSDPAVEGGYAHLIEAVDAAMAIARSRTTAAELFAAMDRIVVGGDTGAGRLGLGSACN